MISQFTLRIHGIHILKKFGGYLRDSLPLPGEFLQVQYWWKLDNFQVHIKNHAFSNHEVELPMSTLL